MRVALAAVVIGVAATMPVASAITDSSGSKPAVHLTVTAASPSVPAPGVAAFYVEAHNNSGRLLTKLDLGSVLTIVGDPENSGDAWSPALGDCGGALSTEYCFIRPLSPGATRTWTLRVRVPPRIGGPNGRSTIGKSVELEAFVDSNRRNKRVVSNGERRSVRITADREH
jgi:hypothetical protein